MGNCLSTQSWTNDCIGFVFVVVCTCVNVFDSADPEERKKNKIEMITNNNPIMINILI